MATKTAPPGARFRRTSQTDATTGRFRRAQAAQPATARWGRQTSTTSQQRPALRMPSNIRPRKNQSQSGIRGMLDRLPDVMRSSSKSRRSSSGLSSKAKPAMAIAAAGAGALLGRRRMQQRKAGEPERTTAAF